ncbi:MAG: TIGR03013 family XrtA/PEP-CTERM system glycosyltransferase [Pseudomonadota bacterium]
MTIRLFDHYIHMSVVVLAIIELCVVLAALALGNYVATEWLWIDGPKPGKFHQLSCAVTAVLVIFSMAAMGLYRIALRASYSGVIARVVVAVVLCGMFLPFLFYVIRPLYIPPEETFVAAGLAILGLAAVRYAFLKLVDESYFKRKVLVLGAGKRAAQFMTLRRLSDQRGFKINKFLWMEGDDPDVKLPDKRVRKLPDNLFEYARSRGIDEIVIAMDDRRGNLPVRELLECRLASIDVTDVMNFLERETGKINLELVRPSWLIFESGFRRQLPRRVAQRIFDVVASAVVLLPAAPLMLITSVLIKLEDKGPIFYRQRRVGQNNVPFDVLKFRSMRTDAEAGGKAIWAQKDDDRVTRVGRVIRKIRIDELPQLINVLRGEMSVVGPRPERPEFVDQLSEDLPYYLERHRVKPGITGWAQLCYPYGSSAKDAFEKLQYDLYYVKNRSLIFDFMILLQTAEVVLWQKGAR